MDEIENRKFEPEFLNVLNEVESTLVLGASDGDGKGCTAYCETYNSACTKVDCKANTCTCYGTGNCYSDSCGCDTPSKASTCYQDELPCLNDCGLDSSQTTYYWWAAGSINKYGYYLSTRDNFYPLDTARSRFITTAISASSPSYCAICSSLISNSSNITRIRQTGRTKFYTSGTASTIVGSTSSTHFTIGYVFVESSATTHMSEITPIKVYAQSFSSQTYFNNSVWPVITSTTATTPMYTYAYVPEKTFTINVYSGTTTSNYQEVQGAYVSINNLLEIFPQFSSGISPTRPVLRTGTEGIMVLCTSSTTSTTITGSVYRKGFNGGESVPFTATQATRTTIRLNQSTSTADNETITVGNANEIIPEGLLHPNTAITSQNLTQTVIGNWSGSVEPFKSSLNLYEVLTFKNVKKIEPATVYFVNDPVLGKGNALTYHATGKTLTQSLQTYAQIPWNTAKDLTIVSPIIRNTNSSTEAFVELWCSFNSNDYYLDTINVLASLTASTILHVSLFHLTGQQPTSGEDVTLYLKAKLVSNVSSVQIIGGNYSYVSKLHGSVS